jgi:hypothetical protein
MMTVCALLVLHYSIEYRYDPAYRRIVTHRFGINDVSGQFNANGDFVPDFASIPSNDTFATTGRRGMPVLSLIRAGERVYEYRSAYLVPMVNHSHDGLVPDLNTKIIRFSDYRYGLLSRRIYNLPGAFVLKR